MSADCYRYELAIGAIFRDEAPYLKEWIEFHKLVGVQHFYLFNHFSTDDYQSVLQPYVERGEVELIEWPHPSNSWNHWLYDVQPKAYVACLNLAKGKAKWLAIIDIDEFLTPISANSVPDILKEYEEFGGVCFNWKIFGHSGWWDLYPDKLLIESLVMTAPHDRSTHLGIKSIVRPERVEGCQHPHYVRFYDGFYSVNSNKEPCIYPEGTTNGVYYDTLVVNHYWSRTGNALYKKLKRYKESFFPEIVPEIWPEYVKGMNELEDCTMQRFVVPLRLQMGLSTSQ